METPRVIFYYNLLLTALGASISDHLIIGTWAHSSIIQIMVRAIMVANPLTTALYTAVYYHNRIENSKDNESMRQMSPHADAARSVLQMSIVSINLLSITLTAIWIAFFMFCAESIMMAYLFTPYLMCSILSVYLFSYWTGK